MAEPQTHLRIGSTLHSGSYKIEKVLGQGGFGITYLATDLSLDRKVAIKEFFPKDYCDRNEDTSHVTLGTQSNRDFIDKLKIKFLKEARNIAKLDFPGIIKIFAAFEENDTAYYVMEYIEGASLSDLVKRRGPLPVNVALKYIDKVGRALEYVHARKINHLDVKPANIMLRASDDQPILIDFGLSKQYDHSGNQTSTTPVGISHGYAPMEQYNIGGVKKFSPQTDLYSLAATLYYLVTGATPASAQDIFDEGLRLPASFPRQLYGPITRALSPAKRDRHETVGRFLAELRGGGGEQTQMPSDDSTRMGAGAPPSDGRTTFTGGQSQPTFNMQQAAVAEPEPEPNNTMRYVIIGVLVLIISALVGWYLGKSKGGDTAEVPAVETTAEAAPVVSEAAPAPAAAPAYPSNSAFGQILSSPYVSQGGYQYHYYEGTYTTWNQSFAICFVTEGNRLIRVVFKDFQTYKQVDMTFNVSGNGDLTLTGYVDPAARKGKWTMTYQGTQGNTINGVGRTSKQTIPAPIHPTDYEFNL